jgi:hypothetical protein
MHNVQEEDELYLFQRMRSFIRRQQQDAQISEEDHGLVVAFKFVVYALIQKPFMFLRNLTIPLSEDENWRRSYA